MADERDYSFASCANENKNGACVVLIDVLIQIEIESVYLCALSVPFQIKRIIFSLRWPLAKQQSLSFHFRNSNSECAAPSNLNNRYATSVWCENKINQLLTDSARIKIIFFYPKSIYCVRPPKSLWLSTQISEIGFSTIRTMGPNIKLNFGLSFHMIFLVSKILICVIRFSRILFMTNIVHVIIIFCSGEIGRKSWEYQNEVNWQLNSQLKSASILSWIVWMKYNAIFITRRLFPHNISLNLFCRFIANQTCLACSSSVSKTYTIRYERWTRINWK